MLCEGEVDWSEVAGATVDGVISGGIRGAVLTSGGPLVNAVVSAGADFIGGFAGSCAEQKLRGGKINFADSLFNGFDNAITGVIGGNKKLKNGKQAFLRNGMAGSASAGMNYLYNNHKNNKTSGLGNLGSVLSGVLGRMP